MRAIVYTKYGPPDVLELKVVEKPIPKDDEVLIKVHAASVNAADWHLLTADIFLVRLMGGGFLKPKNKILGADIAGRVEAVGLVDVESSSQTGSPISLFGVASNRKGTSSGLHRTFRQMLGYRRTV